MQTYSFMKFKTTLRLSYVRKLCTKVDSVSFDHRFAYVPNINWIIIQSINILPFAISVIF
jgi:hypothetical protein